MTLRAHVRIVVAHVACAGALAGLTGCGEVKRPNLLLVTLDTTRADRIGAYGYEQAQTPVLDALAEQGVVFEEAYTPAPMTLPAHATMLTGLLPPEHGARVNGSHRVADDVPTLGEWLSEDGYRTGAFIAALVLDEKFGLARGFDHYDDDLTGAYSQGGSEGLAKYRAGNLVVDSALEWLATSDAAQPFFAWVHLYDPHVPWRAHGAELRYPLKRTYDKEIRFVDEQIGRLLTVLDERGLRENTVVMAVADHGEGLRDHHELEHGYLLNEEVLHVPWIIAGPGVKPGHRVPALVSLADLQPTALELLGVGGGGASGRSLVPALRGESIESGTPYAETELPWTSFRWSPQYSLTTTRWKYVRTPETELYDRTSDRSERVNLAEANADVVAELDARLSALEATFVVRNSDAAAVTAEDLEKLAALGYAAGTAGDLPDDPRTLADVKARLPVKDLADELSRSIAKLEPREQVELALRLVTASPETPSFHNRLGNAYLELGDFERALPELELTVELAPTSAGAHEALGAALVQMRRYVDARPHFEFAIERDPELAAAHVGIGNVLLAERRPEQAEDAFTEALRLRPDNAKARLGLGRTFADRGELAKALDHFTQALEDDPDWTLARRHLAPLLTRLGRAEDALPHFAVALAEFKGDAKLHVDFGAALRRLGRRREARAQFVRALRLRSDFYEPRCQLAELASDLGNEGESLLQHERALILAPDVAEPAWRLARFLATTSDESIRDGARAVELAERAVEIAGRESSHVLDALAAAYASVGRFAEAASVAQRARERALAEGDAAFAAEVEQCRVRYARGEA